MIGLFLPLAYVLGGFARNDQRSVRAATPHLFPLSCQVLSENLVSGLAIFSLPVTALLPILYNGRRLFALVDWCRGDKASCENAGYSTPHFVVFRRTFFPSPLLGVAGLCPRTEKKSTEIAEYRGCYLLSLFVNVPRTAPLHRTTTTFLECTK